MKKTIIIQERGQKKEKQINNIPFRYILSVTIILLEFALIIAAVVTLTVFIPYFYIAVAVTQFSVAVAIIASADNPEYKVPWLFFVMLIPIIGFMCYFMFYSRKLSGRQLKRIERLTANRVQKDDSAAIEQLKAKNIGAYSQAFALKNITTTHLYDNTAIDYFPLGEDMFEAMKQDIAAAKQFIFMEYFIIEDGEFWGAILQLLKEKAAAGVEVRLIYDDIGCMMTLPGNYYKTMSKYGIKCVPFSKLKGQANNEFNNRSHRKITVIDGVVGYTGGINIADEYINRVQKHGHWKDTAIRLRGEAVNELTRLFLIDYGLNSKTEESDFSAYFVNADSQSTAQTIADSGYCVPFGDGPKPIYSRRVAKTAIINMLSQASNYVYITTPYLIIDNDLVSALEAAALRGVDTRIITPHIPDKKAVFVMTRGYYERLICAGVKIYEYEPGFIHAKSYLADGEIAMIGTINLDFRSLVHHFENGVWMYKCAAVKSLESDFLLTQQKCIEIQKGMLKQTLRQRFVHTLVNIFAPLL